MDESLTNIDNSEIKEQNCNLALVIVKPDAYRDGMVDDVISRIEEFGLGLVGYKSLFIDSDKAGNLYTDNEEYLLSVGKKEDPDFTNEEAVSFGRKIRDYNINYMSSGPVVALVFMGENAVERARKIIGASDPSKAEEGTIRGDLSDDSFEAAAERGDTVRNIVHAPDSIENLVKEAKLLFGDDEGIMNSLRAMNPGLFG